MCSKRNKRFQDRFVVKATWGGEAHEVRVVRTRTEYGKY
jgi:hypothetical protein